MIKKIDYIILNKYFKNIFYNCITNSADGLSFGATLSMRLINRFESSLK